MKSWPTTLVLALSLVACGDKDDADSGGESLSGACELVADLTDCPSCYDGVVTCTYGDESVSEGSCGDCQARYALYAQLCDAGVEDSRADIESGLECSDPVPE